MKTIKAQLMQSKGRYTWRVANLDGTTTDHGPYEDLAQVPFLETLPSEPDDAGVETLASNPAK